MQSATIIELAGLILLILTHLSLIVARFQRHENKISAIEKRLEELYENHIKLLENSKILHNIEGKIEIMIDLYQKNIK